MSLLLVKVLLEYKYMHDMGTLKRGLEENEIFESLTWAEMRWKVFKEGKNFSMGK